MRPDSERCGVNLPPESEAAYICSFECTFCASCVDGPLAGVCPNCGGSFERRLARIGAALTRHPAPEVRRFRG